MKKTLLSFLALALTTAYSFSQFYKVNESFGSTTFPPTGWTLSNSNGILSRSATVNGFASTTNLGSVIANYYNVGSGIDRLATYSFSPTIVGDSLRFAHAHAQYPNYPDDSLFIETSTNGTTFTRLVGYPSSSAPVAPFTNTISTNAPVTGIFAPTLASQWGSKVIALPAGTVQVRFAFATGYGNQLYVDNVQVDSSINLNNMTFDSCTSSQSFTSFFIAGEKKQQVMRVAVYTTNPSNPLTVTSLSFNTAGTTSPTINIDSAKVYYTGSSSTFSTSNLFGQVASPNGAFTVTGSRQLIGGVNYFWVAYDLKPGAVVGNSLDAVFTQAVASSVTYFPILAAPPEIFQVATGYTFEASGNSGFTTAVLANTAQDWAKGTPTLVGPSSAYSGANCWGTVLNGNYSLGADYALLSPVYIASTASVGVNFKHWFNIYRSFGNGDQGYFQYKVNSGAWTDLLQLAPGFAAPSNGAWQDYFGTIPNAANDTVQVRWRLQTQSFSVAQPGWYIDNFAILNVSELPMVYISSNTVQDTILTASGFQNQKVLRIDVVANGTGSAINLTQFTFTTNGTTNPADITAARVYYTGLSNTFTTTTQFGTTVNSPSGGFLVNGTQALQPGVNYFWLTFNIANNATAGNSIDADCQALTVASISRTPTTIAPSGNKTIGSGYNFDGTSNQNFFTTIDGGALIQEWLRGTPTSVGPTAAFSAPNCWGTNLSGNYSQNAQYSLYSPTYLATSNNISVAASNWYNFAFNNNAITAAFEYRINSGAWTGLTTMSINNTNTFNSNNAWAEMMGTLTTNVNDTLRFRWRFVSATYSTVAPGWYIDNFAIRNLVEVDLTPPSISYTPLSNISTFTNRVLSGFATITDATGVDTVANKPRLYFKKRSENNTFGVPNNNTGNGWKWVQASNNSSPFSFTINYALLTSSPIVGDTIQYFVVAQDVSPAQNLAANPSVGFSGTSVSNITAAPTTPNSYIFTSSPLSGNYTVGVGQAYGSITSAVTDLNLRGVSAPVNFILTDQNYTTATETFPITISSFAGASNTNVVTIYPLQTNTIIGANNTAIIRFNGARYVTINGATGGGSNRDLTIIDSSTSVSTAVVHFASAGVGQGCIGDTLMNVNIMNGSSTANPSFGIYIGSTSIGTAGADNLNIGIHNVSVSRSYIGIAVDGTAPNPSNLLSIRNCAIGSNTLGSYIGYTGLRMTNINNATITRNSIFNIITTNTNPPAVLFGSGCANSTFSANIIDSIRYSGTGGYGARGILIGTGNTNSNLTISNNMISRIGGDGWTGFNSDNIIGIGIGTTGSAITSTTGGINLYYNTISLSQTFAGYNSATLSYGLMVTSTASNLNIRNNIITNNSANTTNAGAKSYAFGSQAVAAAFNQLNYNNYFAGSTQGVIGLFGGADQTTLAALRTATTKDQNSVNNYTQFVSNSDLHLTGVSVGDLGLGCLPVAGFTTDFDGQTRNAGWHYMGADEVLGAPLPVELSAFNAKAISNDVLLTWTTASETNNSHFEILRSADGVSFSSIKNVKGKGTTTRASAYTELDADANKYAQNNKLYYQLKQVDLDGKNTYSDIVCVLFGQPVSDQVTVFPNPTQDVATILFSEMNAGVVDYQITDIHGKTLLSGQTWVKDYALQIESVQNLPHGIYFVQLNTQKVSHTMKLIKD